MTRYFVSIRERDPRGLFNPTIYAGEFEAPNAAAARAAAAESYEAARLSPLPVAGPDAEFIAKMNALLASRPRASACEIVARISKARRSAQ
jgi:hypothetical protein